MKSTRSALSFLPGFGLSLFRFVSCAWVGGAVLFVVTSVAEQRSPEFTDTIRDQLATIRFPLYYMFAAWAYGLMILGALLFFVFADNANRRRAGLIALLLLASTSILVLDYVMIFQPLQAEIIPPGKPRTEEFDRLHTLSRYANQTHLLILLAAASFAVQPLRADISATSQPADA